MKIRYFLDHKRPILYAMHILGNLGGISGVNFFSADISTGLSGVDFVKLFSTPPYTVAKINSALTKTTKEKYIRPRDFQTTSTSGTAHTCQHC